MISRKLRDMGDRKLIAGKAVLCLIMMGVCLPLNHARSQGVDTTEICQYNATQLSPDFWSTAHENYVRDCILKTHRTGIIPDRVEANKNIPTSKTIYSVLVCPRFGDRCEVDSFQDSLAECKQRVALLKRVGQIVEDKSDIHCNNGITVSH